jgi:hypothetical protein
MFLQGSTQNSENNNYSFAQGMTDLKPVLKLKII